MGRMRLLEADPDLAVLVPPERRGDALRRFEIDVTAIGRGRWRASELPLPREGAIAMMVLDGAVGLTVSLGERHHLELLGPGDVIQPWLDLSDGGPLSPTMTWRVVTQSRIAYLGPGFARDAATHPEVLTSVMHRLVQRVRRVDLIAAVTSLPRVRDRLLLILWQLAERWGRVTPEGVRVELPLSHQDIADLIAVRRPSVTEALAELADSVGRQDRLWMLTGSPPEELEILRMRLGLPRPDQPRS